MADAAEDVLKREEAYWEARDEHDWLTEESIQEILKKIPTPKGKVLELCIGSGMFTRQTNIDGAKEYTGLDLSATLLRKLKKDMPRIKTIKGDAQKLDFPNNYFDQVFLFAGLHHLPKMYDSIQETFRVLSPGGTYVCFEPNNDAWYRPIMLKLRKFLMIYTDDETFLRPMHVKGLLEKAGFRDCEVQYISPSYKFKGGRMLLFPFYIGMKLTMLIPGRRTQSFFIISCKK